MVHRPASKRILYSGKPPLVYRAIGTTMPTRLGGDGSRNVIDRHVQEERSAQGDMSVPPDPLQSFDMGDDDVADNLIVPDTNLPPSPISPPPVISTSSTTPTDTSIRNLADALLDIKRRAGAKIVGKLLFALSAAKLDLGEFMHRIPDTKGLLNYEAEQLRVEMVSVGFTQMQIDGPGGTRCVMFARDPLQVLRDQIIRTPSKHIVTHPVLSSSMSHPLSASLGRDAESSIRQAILISKHRHVYWHTRAMTGEESFVGFAQLYSDKSQTSMKSGSLHFYPLHITLHNFSEESRHGHITSGRTILAYLPVHFSNVTALENVEQSVRDSKFYEVSRTNRILTTHHCIEQALSPLGAVAECGFQCIDGGSLALRCHTAIGSYCADIPEAKDLLSVRHGNLTAMPCPRCKVTKENMVKYMEPYDRLLHETLKTQAEYRQAHEKASAQPPSCRKDKQKAAENILSKQSLQTYPPLLHKFPFVGIHPSLDIYSIFHFEPMHNLPLGVSRLLKSCALDRLRSDALTTEAMLTSTDTPKKFSTIRRTVLKETNAFLARTEKSSHGYGLRLDFSSGVTGCEIRGLFSEKGLCGMLEAKDYLNVDQVSPFLGAIFDRFCGEMTSAPVTTVFTMYVDLCQFLSRKGMSPGWTPHDLDTLVNMITTLKSKGTLLFSEFQNSGMATIKWHLLDHIPQDIFRLGGLSFSDASLYEYSHILFKLMYRKTSRRVGTAMAETVSKLDVQKVCDDTSLAAGSDGTRSGGPLASSSRVYSANMDSTTVAQTGPVFALRALTVAYNNLYQWRHVRGSSGTAPIDCDKLRNFTEWLCEDELRALLKLLDDILKDMSPNRASHATPEFQFPASGYVSSRYPPSLSDSVADYREVYLPPSTFRVSVRIAAASTYYGRESPRRDSVMIGAPPDHRFSAPYNSTRVWFGRLLSFTRCRTDLSRDFDMEECDAHSVRSCRRCMVRHGQVYAIVQYYEVLGADLLPADAIDVALNCIRLRWARTEGDGASRSAAKWYGFCPIDSILGKIHVVEMRDTLRHLSDSDPRKEEVFGFGSDNSAPWETEQFYVNRFYNLRGDHFEI